jgi:hypothetical protein
VKASAKARANPETSIFMTLPLLLLLGAAITPAGREMFQADCEKLRAFSTALPPGWPSVVVVVHTDVIAGGPAARSGATYFEPNGLRAEQKLLTKVVILEQVFALSCSWNEEIDNEG